MKKIIQLAFFLSLTFVVQCTGPQTRETAESGSDFFSTKLKTFEPETRSLYSQAEKAFQNKNYDLSIRLFTQLKQKFPRSRAQAYGEYRLGMLYYFTENYEKASQSFEAHLMALPQSELAFDTTYNWAACEFQLNHPERVLQILSRLSRSEVQSQGSQRAETVYVLVAKAADAVRNYPLAIKAFAYQLQLPVDAIVRQGVEARVEEELNYINQVPVLEKLLGEVDQPSVRTKIQAKMDFLREDSGHISSSIATAPMEVVRPVSGFVSEPYRKEALSLNPYGSIGDGETIGILLPLSGKAANYGKKALEGILVAAEWMQKNGVNYNLDIRDTQSSPYAALSELEDLINTKHVMAVVGPIHYREAQLVSEKCQQQGILNISLASKEGLSEKGAYIFQNAITPRVQIENLVRFCMEEKKMKRFGILAPNNQFGKELSQIFWDEVEARGGHISASQTYAAEDSDFQKPIQELAGLTDLPKNRPEEWKRLSEFIQEEKKKTNKEPKVRLSGIADFDALFIPESVKNMSQIAPTLAFNDLSKVPVLGTTEWNTEQFIQRGGKYIETIYLPSSSQSPASDSDGADYLRTFKNTYDRNPELLASQSYEALWLIGLGLKKSGSRDRNQIVQNLYQFKNLPSPLGTFEFDSKRIAKRRLGILLSKQGFLTRVEN